MNWLPARSRGGAGDAALPWQPSHAIGTSTTPSMCGALAGWQVAHAFDAWLGGGWPWQLVHGVGPPGVAQRGCSLVPPAAASTSPWQ
jgi:hypothetical protein